MTANAGSKPNPTPSGWALAMHGGALEPFTQYAYSAEYWVERTRPWDEDGADYAMKEADMCLRVIRREP